MNKPSYFCLLLDYLRKPEEKRQLVRARCRWEDNTKMYPKEIGFEGVNWRQITRIGLNDGLL
jgi:hypothetical protein